MALVGTAMAIGTALAAVMSRPLTRLLQDVSPLDPIAYASVLLLLFTATFLAAYLPARRAARLDPMASLRQD
jgi:ABC-type antimicrobial peptide transport system permease subunit